MKSLELRVHQRIADLITNKDVGLRRLAHVLRDKAAEIERIAPRDWQIVADTASAIEAHDDVLLREMLRPIDEEFRSLTTDKDGFEAYALGRFVRALLKTSLKGKNAPTPTCDFSRVPADQIPY